MAQQVEIDNFGSLNVVDSDKLEADVLPGANQIQTDNTANYTVGQYVCIGALGTEGCEIGTVASIVDATHLQFTNPVKLKHDRFDALTPLNGDQIKVYRAPNMTGLLPDDSTFGVLGSVPIVVSDPVTLYIDSSGGNAYWYKSTYYNSATNFESTLADSTAARGGGYDYYASAYAIRKTAGLVNNQYITDADIDEKRKEAQDEIDAALTGMYTTPFQPPIDSMISGITRLLAAGKLMMDDPGGQGANSLIYKEGQDKINQARKMLKLIDDRAYTITDSNGASTMSPNSQSSKSFPDATTVAQGGGQPGNDRLFRMSDVADGSRRY